MNDTQGGRIGFLVVGSARSGTTLVQRLICELPGVRMPPETHFFSQFAPKLLERREFPLNAEQISEEVASFAALDTSRGLEIDTEAVVAELGGTCARPFDLFDALVRQLSGPAEMWGEKTPDHLMWWRPVARSAPWVRFVAVVRDPRAVVASSLQMPWTGDSRMPAWGDDVHLAFAERWACLQRHLSAMQIELDPSRTMSVRYEDVVADPDGTRAALAEFLGRPAPSALQAPPAQIVQPWEPWKRDSLGPVTKDRLHTWNEALGTRRSREVAAVCHRGMRELGYDGATARAPLRASTWLAMGPRAIARLLRYRRAYEGYLERIDQRSV